MAAKNKKRIKPRGKYTEKVAANRWQKGQSGNPAGRPPAGFSFAELIREFGDKEIPAKYRKVCEEICKDFGDTWKHGFVAMMYKFAFEGQAQFANYLIERVDGRAPLVNINNQTDVHAVVVLPEIVETQVDPVEQIEVSRDNLLQLPPVNGNGNGHNGHSDLLDRP